MKLVTNKLALKKTALALAVTGILGLSGCIADKTTNEVPVDKTTSGVITGFGSVFINGIEYETDDASFVVDGVTGDESLLKLGMVVSLKGSASADGTGDALSIEFDDDVEGIVISKDLADGLGTINIMGVTVTVDEDTVFESKEDTIVSASDIAVGNIIEVSGHSSGDGSVWATRIEVKSAAKVSGKDMEVKGTITGLDTVAETFTLGSITVDYSAAVLKDELTIADDLYVEVKSADGLNDSGALIASKIELEDEGEKSLEHEDGDDEVELEGVITKRVSDTEIEVNGHTVLLAASTRYAHGSATVTAVGMKIKVKGDVNANGDLVAKKVIFKPTGDLRLAGRIEATDVAMNTVTIFGVKIILGNSTMVKDDRDDDDLGNDSENVKYKFGVDDLAVGDWIKVKAYTNKDGGLTATKMERETKDADEDAKLVGKLTLATGTTDYYVAGIKVDISALEGLVTDSKVELKGSFENAVFTATEGESKDADEHYVGGEGEDEDDLDKEDHAEDDSKSEEDSHSDDEPQV